MGLAKFKIGDFICVDKSVFSKGLFLTPEFVYDTSYEIVGFQDNTGHIAIAGIRGFWHTYGWMLASSATPGLQQGLSQQQAPCHHMGCIGKQHCLFLEDTPIICPPPAQELKCECGSEAIGSGGHSNWCPKYVG